MSSAFKPSVAILMATYNGAVNLTEQLDSFTRQTLRPRWLLVSDDGSGDATRAIVERFSRTHPEIETRWIEGPRRGAALNFLHLLGHAPPEAELVAFSDQDDVWLPDKLARAERALRGRSEVVLYCGLHFDCDAKLGHRRLARPRTVRPGFRHALVQNIAGGNTMVLNRPAWELLQAASHEARKLVVHDWWAYQVVTGAGGAVVYDLVPLLLYRQHGGNLIGSNRGIRAKLRRLDKLLRGRLWFWNTVNLRALSASAHRFTPENREILEHFRVGRRGSLWQRLRMLQRTGVHRHGLEGWVSLYVAAVLGRL